MPSLEEMRAMVPESVMRVCQTLRAANYEAWVVGGAVRDLLLGTLPSDWDVASNGLPQDLLPLFKKTIATGLQHGTITAVVGRGNARENVEITTFRGEGEYSDGRRPDSVHFGVPLDEDLKRRDFVINAMAFDPIDAILHDPFGGANDLSLGIVRAVGNPCERFNEDGLRVMRAVRFVSTLGFHLDEATEEALSSALDVLGKVAQERVRVELLKLLGGKGAQHALKIALRRGVAKAVLPELSVGAFEAGIERVSCCSADAVLRLGALLADLEFALIEPVLRRLTLSNEERQRLLAALRFYRDFAVQPCDEQALRLRLASVGRRAASDHLMIQAAQAQRSGDATRADATERGWQILNSGVALELRDLKITGGRVMELTKVRGKALGELLQQLLDAVLQEPERNTKDTLEALAIELASRNPAQP